MSACCSYSFADLYHAAFGRSPESGELEALYALPQNEKNRVVREWAERAGWNVTDIKGTDGHIYAAFAPAAAQIPGNS